MRIVTGSLVCLFVLVGMAARPAGAATCPELSTVSLPNTTISDARLVPAGTFSAPAIGRGGGAGAERRFADQFTATRYQNGKPNGTALVCAYPAAPVYSGGNVKEVSSFVCKTP